MNRRHRKDNNQPELMKQLKAIGIQYKNTSQMGNGFPDLVVGHNGVNYLFEVKQTTKDKLTDDEQAFKERWNGQWQVVVTLEDILKAIGVME